MYRYDMETAVLQAFWSGVSTHNVTSDNDCDGDTKCYSVDMTNFNAKLTICGLGGGVARVDVIVPDGEDLSAGTGLCGNGNGRRRDDPNPDPDTLYRLHLLNDDGGIKTYP